MTADDESRVVAYMTETGLIPQPFWDALDAADLMAAYMADDDPCDDPNCGTCKEAFNTLDVYRTARAKLPAR